jgi:ribonuclease I
MTNIGVYPHACSVKTALQGEIESLQNQKRAVDEQLAAEQARHQEEKTTYDKELEVRSYLILSWQPTKCYIQRLKKRDERLLEDNKKFIREKVCI